MSKPLSYAMKKREYIANYTKDMIELSDINYIPHYWFENLEWQIYEEVKDRLEKDKLSISPSKEQCEFMIRDICKYVFGQIEKEKTDFFLYHLPDYILKLHEATNKEPHKNDYPKISKALTYKYLDDWERKQPTPRQQWYYEDAGKFVAVDNRTWDFFMEEFDNLADCFNYLSDV